ncbi:MAG: tRNA glutamyl-Q(34) synthetase GluQRS [Neisseriaceae bacterium]|nr:tRNA glutamyl-Q(34) synthetase GluQRS [Neisseriaceae bacterium]MBP6862914.1 tRNA glutamyl-Q(34) synthetase GluQRS [Neisseriaceae bacterium]
MSTDYIGRFAPSPTGRLHLGSLLAAVASFLAARSVGGQWLVRMEDLDKPREQPGAAADILTTLTAFGLAWDGDVVYQSQRHGRYQEALAQLQAESLVYPCYCSRKEVMEEGVEGVDGRVYAGYCREATAPRNAHKAPAWRVRVPDQVWGFEDELMGGYQQNLARDIGDFVLKRADGEWAYQLAVVVDDADHGVNHIVRGRDLLVCTPRQQYLQQLLGYPQPAYAHLPLLTNSLGQKLSKQTLAPALDRGAILQQLREVLGYLGIVLVDDYETAETMLAAAVPLWRPARVAQQNIVVMP